MRGHSRRLGGIVAVVLLALASVAGFALAGTSANSAVQVKGTVSLRTTKLGKILVNSNGRTLYLFARDRSGTSACTGKCATFWPPLVSSTKPTAGTGVSASLLGRVRRGDGKMQVTYNKHPLYFFAEDKAAGQAKGENISAFGGEWYVVNAKGVKVEPGEHSGTTTTSPDTTTSTYTDTRTIPGY